MFSPRYDDKICWITGASSGIGAALALHLNALGASIIISARNRENLEKIQSECPRPDKIIILTCDLENAESLSGVATNAWNLFHRIDFVFLNAGLAVRDLIIHTDIRMFRKVMDINYFSNVILSKALIPLMQARGYGNFVITGSLSGKFGIPKLGAYAASKHAVLGFFESLRAEYEKDGIKVTIATVGLVKTDISIHTLNGQGLFSGKKQASIEAGISPSVCARKIIKAAWEGKTEVLVGAMEKYSVYIKRFFPGLLRKAITRHPMEIMRKLGLIRSHSNSTN